MEYDPGQVSLDALLLAYFYVIDPTVENRQGNDRGSQYQTGVYYTNESAKETVERIAEIERGRSEKFFVEIGPLKNYYPAEEYHQNYLEKNPNGYCHIPRAEMELFSRLRIDPGDYQKPAAESIRDKLTAEQYRVTQESGTERAFTGEFWDKFEKGISRGSKRKPERVCFLPDHKADPGNLPGGRKTQRTFIKRKACSASGSCKTTGRCFVVCLKQHESEVGTEKLREAFTYALNQEKYLWVFLTDGDVPMDNNASERAIRGFCVGMKNWQMIDTINGAKSSAIIYSIAETAKANNLKPYEYFEYLLTEIPKHMGDTDRSFSDNLVPWSEMLPESIRKPKKIN